MSRSAMRRDLRAGLRTGQCVLLFVHVENRACVRSSFAGANRVRHGPWRTASRSLPVDAGRRRSPSPALPCWSAAGRGHRMLRARRRAAKPSADAANSPISACRDRALQAETAGQVQAMGELLARPQAELAGSVNERLDAVTQRLGQSMQTTTKHTTENLQKLNERLAVIDSAQKNITDLASQVTSLHERARQQAGARRLRPGPHGSDHPGRAAERRLRIPVHALERQAAGLRDLPAGPAAAGDRREISARSRHRVARRARPTTSASIAAQRLRQDVGKHVTDIAEKYLIPGETQDTGADVRAVGIGLCRAA